MGVPDYQALMLPLLKLAAESDQPIRDCAEQIAFQLDLSKEDREELIPSGRQTTLYNRTHWAATYLVQAGLLERPKRGVVRATSRGREVLATNPDKVDNKLLMTFTEFNDFKRRARPESDEGADIAISADADTKTPVERIDAASKELVAELRDELLSRIIEAGWQFFELLIIDLMRAMGYGGSGSAKHMGKSGDGGIDGVINEDPLGLDIVYLQAKCYAPKNVIGVEKIREFAGTLDERGATKGVFVTTSHFAAAAQQYAERSPKRLILIDGDELTRLLVQYGVGVRSFKTVELKRIDLDYFEAEAE